MRRIFTVLVLTLGLVIAFGAGSAMAVPLHQHSLSTPSGHVALPAQGFCQTPDVFAEGANAHRAFHNFHSNVHLGNPPVGFDHFC